MERPELYGRYSAPMEAAAARALDEAWPLLRWPPAAAHLPVIDIGCGPGDVAAKVLAPWLPRGTRIVSCDVSEAMLRYARANNCPAGVTYERLDVADPLLEQSAPAVWRQAPFSKAFAFLLLHWLPDNRVALANIYKLLAPGGEALFTIITKIATYDVYDKMAEDPRWAPYLKDRQRFESPYRHSEDPAKDFEELLQAEGFQLLLCSVRPEAGAFASEEEIKVVLQSVNPFVSRVPEEQRPEFLEEAFRLFRQLGGATAEVDAVTGAPRWRYRLTAMTALARKTTRLRL